VLSKPVEEKHLFLSDKVCLMKELESKTAQQIIAAKYKHLAITKLMRLLGKGKALRKPTQCCTIKLSRKYTIKSFSFISDNH